MRRTIEQAQAEIMQNKARHDAAAAQRRRVIKNTVIPALSAAAVFALVLGFAILPLLKGPGRTAPEGYAYGDQTVNTADPQRDESTEGGAAVSDGYDSEAACANTTPKPEVSVENAGSPQGAELGPWLCGTPGIEGGWYELEDEITYDAMPDGGILIVPKGDDRNNYWIGVELAARMYGCIAQLEPDENADIPDSAEVLHIISLTFGNDTLRVIALGDGTFILNAGTVCTLDASAAAELGELVREAQK